MVVECVYNPAVDLHPVDQTGYVDLAKANSMSAIPAQLTAEALSFNGIDDPNSICARPADVFEAGQAGKAIGARAEAAKAAANASKAAPKTE